MTPHYDPEKGKLLRETAKEVPALQAELKLGLAEAQETGNLERARDAFAALQAPMKLLETLRQELGPAGLFAAKYGVEIESDHSISFVILGGVSRLEIIEEAHGLVKDRNLIYPPDLEKWRKDPKFTEKATKSERFFIDGHVPNSVNKTRQEQEQYVKDQGKRHSLKVELPTLEDLAVAFSLFYVANEGQSLFGRGWAVRADGGTLDFHSYGLVVSDFYGDSRSSGLVAVSARALPESKKLDSWFLDSWVRRFLAPAQRGLGFGFLEKSE